MTDYVVGFAFDDSIGQVLLVRKNQPTWQRGKLNGIGGKIELHESPYIAMGREFTEETDLEIPAEDWKYAFLLKSGSHNIHFFSTIWDIFSLTMCHLHLNDVGERLELWNVAELSHEQKKIPNLNWIVPLLAYQHDNYQPFTIVEDN